MKCQKCQAKLLPVDGQMFCLQDGSVYEPVVGDDTVGPIAEETVDPLLQKAITDSRGRPVMFRAIPKPIAAIPAAVRGPTPVPSKRRKLSRPWLAGVAFGVVFGILNAAAVLGLNGRVFLGVQVGNLTLGGHTSVQAAEQLEQLPVLHDLKLTVEGKVYWLTVGDVVRLDEPATLKQAMAVGRSQALPLMGALSAWTAPAVQPVYVIDEPKLAAKLAELASQIDRPASSAWIMAFNGQVQVVSEHKGVAVRQLQAIAAVKRALSLHQTGFALPVQATDPLVGVGSLGKQSDGANAILATPLVVRVKTKTYTPGVTQVAGWLRFPGGDREAVVDAAAVAGYVNSLPGLFDRAGMTGAIVKALNAHQALTYQAVTRKVTKAPVALAAAVSTVSYRYCLKANNAADLSMLRSRVTEALTDPSGWMLGSRVSFLEGTRNCNFTIALNTSEQMRLLNPACDKRLSCGVEATLAIGLVGWKQMPAGWTKGLPAYQHELINHEVGQWLGYDHAACLKPAVAPALSLPSVVIDGSCSPDWYRTEGKLAATRNSFE